MKIATLSTLDTGGAGIGSRRRVAALRDRGIDAALYAYIVAGDQPDTIRLKARNPLLDVVNSRWRWMHLHRKAILAIQNLPQYTGREIFSNTKFVVGQRQLARIARDNDVVHLHWIVGLLDYDRLVQTLGNTPVVWTLADMNPFTGGCHYSEGCERFASACEKCPLLGDDPVIANAIWQRKHKALTGLPNLQVICPSQWMADRAARSTVFAGREIHTIPNPFPASQFSAIDRVEARQKLGWSADARILLFGADSVNSSRKGGDLLETIMQELAGAGPDYHDVEVALFGEGELNLPFKTHRLGFLDDSQRLSLAYSAADAYLLASREDNAPLTVSEALHCDTPVVSFEVGHVPEIVDHLKTGYIARQGDIGDFVSGIQWALDQGPKRDSGRRLLCRRSAMNFHNNDAIIDRHIGVYRHAIETAN